MEDRIKKNHYDVEARSVLSYLEKLKWRSIFAYEEHCATIVQRYVCMYVCMYVGNVDIQSHMREIGVLKSTSRMYVCMNYPRNVYIGRC